MKNTAIFRRRVHGALSIKVNADLERSAHHIKNSIAHLCTSVKSYFTLCGETCIIVNMNATAPDVTLFDRFARFYDDDYREVDADLDMLAMLAAEWGEPLLELGCGTGRVLAPLAAAGHRITGVDISPALLAHAARKVQEHALSGRVQLVAADLRTFDLPHKEFAFAFCVSNTLMHLTTADDQLAVLRNAARHLRPGGRLLIDLFNPDLSRLFAIDGLLELADQWQDAATGADVLKWSVRRLDVAAQLQETLFIYEEVFADGRTQRTACPFTLRYLWRSEAELMLQLAGFIVEEVWGDFEGAPYADGAEQLILIATKP